jgi:hypothetical protein
MCMFEYINVCIHLECMYIYRFIYIYICIRYVNLCKNISMYVHVDESVYFIFMYDYKCMFLWIYLCISIYVHVYVYLCLIHVLLGNSDDKSSKDLKTTDSIPAIVQTINPENKLQFLVVCRYAKLTLNEQNVVKTASIIG